MQRGVISGLAVLMCVCLAIRAQALEPAPGRFAVEGTRLIFDTEQPNDTHPDQPDEIVIADVDRLRQMLATHTEVTELQLNSSGGSIYASGEMAWIVLDYGLDTLVVGECTSACVDLFLAGGRRRMTLGSKIGFHRRSWSPEAVANYYDEQRQEFGWNSPFEYGSWIYQDTQAEVFAHLTYMLERGVEPGFAIKTLSPGAKDVWFPNRLQLMTAGVLRETVD